MFFFVSKSIDNALKFPLANDCDFLVIGAGVAGMRAAIELADAGTVLVIAKDSLRESSSEYAQGGIAAALNDDDRIELHEQDTIYAGDGLCNVRPSARWWKKLRPQFRN